MVDVVYQYGADIEQILAALNQIDKKNEDVYRKAEAAANKAIKGIIADHQRLIGLTDKLDKSVADEAKQYDKLAQEAAKAAKAGQDAGEKSGQAAQSSGIQIGFMAGIVSSITTEFIRLGEQAVRILEDIAKKAVETATQFDSTRASFKGIFGGSKEAADEAFDFIQKRSVALGIDLQQLAAVFLPKVGSLEQFEQIAKLATAIQRSTPGIIEGGATRALTEALTGQFVSLEKIGNVARSDIKDIKKAFEESGVTGLITELNKVLERTGRSFDTTKDTAAAAFSRISQATEQLEGKIGEPIVKELENLAVKGLGSLGTLKDGVFTFNDDVLVLADTFGRVAAEALKFLTNIDFSKLDTKQLQEVADYAYRIVKALEIAATQVGTFLKQFSDLPGVAQILQGLEYEVTHLDDALITFSQIIALVNAELAAFEAASNKAAIGLDLAKAGLDSASLNYGKVIEDLKAANEKLNTNTDAQAAYNASIQASAKQFDDYNKSLGDNKKAQDDLKNTLDDQKNSTDEAAKAILAKNQADRDAADAAEKLKDATDKVNKAEEDAAKDYGRKLEDIDKNFERKRLDIAIEFAQKREDLSREDVQKLDDIYHKYQQDVSDAQLDLTRKEEDIARKHGQEIADLEKTQKQKRLDIETTYRRKLQDIQRTFLLDADEAEKKRDAVAYLQALKKRNEDVKSAQIERSRTIQDTKVEGEQKRQELAIQQKREIQDAKIANERKLEDLKTNLHRQYEAQELAYQRQLQAIAIGEQRKNEEAATAREREREDAKTAYDRKLSDLKESLSAEYDIIKEGNAKIEDEQARHNAAMAESGPASQPPGQDYTPYDTQIKKKQSTYQAKSIYGYAAGGYVPPGQQALVGERGPELASITRGGAYITPNAALRLNSFVPSGARGGSVNNNFSQQVTLPDVAGLINNPVAVRQVENIVARALGRIF